MLIIDITAEETEKGVHIMYTKLEINGTIELVTGMHIGASEQFAAIGAVDSPVLRDIHSDLPIIPGSSLKGKIRALLAKKYNVGITNNHNEDAPEILRLFGCSQKGKMKRSRLIFSDMILSNIDEFNAIGIYSATEVKFENSINRFSAMANPRQIERTIRGSKFPLTIIYDAEDESEIVDDIKLLCDGLKLLKYDYIGGHGSRGYGKVQINDLDIKIAIGDVDGEILSKCSELLKEV